MGMTWKTERITEDIQGREASCSSFGSTWLLGVHGALEAQPAHVPQLRYGQDVLHEGCLGYMSYCTAANGYKTT